MAERWATFDCYGTLIDWNRGIRAVLSETFGAARADERLRAYHELEPRLEHDARLTYREVLTAAMRELGAPAEARHRLAESLPAWPPFPEVPAALRELRARGWRLAILSNTDRDYLDASITAIGVPIDLSVAASEIHSYKPAHRHWHAFFVQSGADHRDTVHVAASLFHDIAPAADLGLRSIWINRLGERSVVPRANELADLTLLPETLDALG